MTGRAGSVASLNDVRALMDTFVSQGWRSVVIRVDDCEFLFSRDTLLERALPVAATSGTLAAAPVAANVNLQSVLAPHVATLIEIAAVGSKVTKGGQVAVLSVLEERVEIFATASGHILEHKAKLGALVEYGQVLAELTPEFE